MLSPAYIQVQYHLHCDAPLVSVVLILSISMIGLSSDVTQHIVFIGVVLSHEPKWTSILTSDN